MIFACCASNRKDIIETQNKREIIETQSVENERSELILSTRNVKIHSATYHNTQKFIPNFNFGRVIKVYDGDTITVAAELSENGEVYRFNLRLLNVDTPELRTSNKTEKKAGLIVQRFLEKLILYKFVKINIHGTDKYGRLLADVFLKIESDVEINISEWLLNNRYAVPYDGGKKKCPENWIEYINQSS